MTEYEYQTEIVARRLAYEAMEKECCYGCAERIGVPCLKAPKCEKLKEGNENEDRKNNRG